MALFVLALGVRLLFLWETCNTPLSLHLSGDEEGYYLWAKAIAAGEWSRNRPFYQAPLYPYFLAVFHLLPGMGPGLIRIIQAVLSSGACVLCAAAGRTWFGPRAGLFAGVLLALYPPAIYFTGLLQKTTLALFLASLFLFGASSSGWKRWKWFASGLILGGLCLTRENAAVWLPVSVAFLILRPCPNRARRLQCAVMLAIGFFMALAPALAHNWAAADRPMWITSQFGPNLYIGNRPDAGGLFVPLLPGRDHWRYEEMDARALAEKETGHLLDPVEVSAFWTQKALTDIRKDPLGWMALMIRKGLLLLNDLEIGDTRDILTCSNHSTTLRFLMPVFSFGTLLMLGVFGLGMGFPWNRNHLFALALFCPIWPGSVFFRFLTATAFPWSCSWPCSRGPGWWVFSRQKETHERRPFPWPWPLWRGSSPVFPW